MSKQAIPGKPAKSEMRGKGASDRPPAPPIGRTVRETVESVVIAFVLAFLFRTFEAEAFVIPTGSMAPTLQGRHKDVTCPKCGYAYKASASEEVDSEGNFKPPGDWPAEASCPLCRYPIAVGSETKEYSYNGDRILVAKGLYEFFEPRRWDVFVFKYPHNAKINYIKRLVGLPNETIRLAHGDVFTSREGGPFEIQRKPPHKLRAMMQIVYDNNYVVDEMTKKGWPLRWQPSPEDEEIWTSEDGGRTYANKPSAKRESWLRYQHFVPTETEWQIMSDGNLPKGRQIRPQLITDYYAYNDWVAEKKLSPPLARSDDSYGLNWVGDLAVECQVEVKNETGLVILDLVKAGRRHRCTIDVATGKARLSIDGLRGFAPEAQTDLRGAGSYDLMFANCDQQLLLWVDSDVVEFDKNGNAATCFAATEPDRPRHGARGEASDLAPAGVGARGAEIGVSELRLWRDIYYIADKRRKSPYESVEITENEKLPRAYGRGSMVQFLSDPKQWGNGSPDGESVFDKRKTVDFVLGKDQFFALGDNSPASQDSRLWREDKHPVEEKDLHAVDRELLIGKALYIYWPHAWPTPVNVSIPVFGMEMRVPFYPNFKRMTLVR